MLGLAQPAPTPVLLRHAPCRIYRQRLGVQATQVDPDPSVSLFELAGQLQRAEAVKLFYQVGGPASNLLGNLAVALAECLPEYLQQRAT